MFGRDSKFRKRNKQKEYERQITWIEIWLKEIQSHNVPGRGWGEAGLPYHQMITLLSHSKLAIKEKQQELHKEHTGERSVLRMKTNVGIKRRQKLVQLVVMGVDFEVQIVFEEYVEPYEIGLGVHRIRQIFQTMKVYAKHVQEQEDRYVLYEVYEWEDVKQEAKWKAYVPLNAQEAYKVWVQNLQREVEEAEKRIQMHERLQQEKRKEILHKRFESDKEVE